MKKVMATIFTLLVATSAFAMDVQTTPAHGPEVQSGTSGHLVSSTTDFIQQSDGTYAIHVYAEFFTPHQPPEFVDAGTFVPKEGSIVRKGDTLVWKVNGQSVEVAQTSFWSTFPQWSLENGVVHTQLSRAEGPWFEKYQASVKLSAF